jgi:hypothetical protein
VNELCTCELLDDAQTQTHICRPNEHAACRARLDRAYTIAADDADGRRAKEDAVPQKTANENGSGPGCEGTNNAPKFVTEAAAGPEGLTLRRLDSVRHSAARNCASVDARLRVDPESTAKPLASVSRVDFPIEIAQVGQSVHRQAVFVRFALDVHFHQMPGQPFTGTPGLGTVCKCAVYAQRAIDG